MQVEEQEELTDAEKATLFVQLLEKRRKHFAAKREEEKRNRPPTKAQQRSIMCTYLKNMAGWKPKYLKNKSFLTIQDLFDKAMKRTREESSSKRAGDELESDNSKKHKLDEKVEAEVDNAKEAEELKQCLEIVPNDGDEVTINATPLSVKIPIMLKNFDREDLEVLWKIVKARFKKTKPVNYMDDFLLLNLKTMFEHHVEDGVWKNQQGLVKVLNWKLFYSCRVHCVTVQSISYYLLVEKKYPLTNHILHQMFHDVKLRVEYECEMAYELLRLGRIVGIKRLHDDLGVNTAKVRVTALKQNLVLLVILMKNYVSVSLVVIWLEYHNIASVHSTDSICLVTARGSNAVVYNFLVVVYRAECAMASQVTTTDRKDNKTKRSKNSQKPTRNGEGKTKSEDGKPNQSKPDQPDTARKESK
ncbi:hypothetical protein Tco_1059336 [Tanacetum coccineum]